MLVYQWHVCSNLSTELKRTCQLFCSMPIVRVSYDPSQSRQELERTLPRNPPGRLPKFSKIVEYKCPKCDTTFHKTYSHFSIERVKSNYLAKPMCDRKAWHGLGKSNILTKCRTKAYGWEWFYENAVLTSFHHGSDPEESYSST